jgi:hypothetical protein
MTDPSDRGREMSVDFTKFPFSTVVRPDAATLTEAITADPVDSGFIVITVKAADQDALASAVATFVGAARANAESSNLVDVSAYRQLRADELGGAVPFDQPICEAILADAGHDIATIGARAEATVLKDPRVDWLILITYRSPESAAQSAKSYSEGSKAEFAPLAAISEMSTVGAFKNMKRYSSVSRDPNVIQFFNLFGAPDDLDVLWKAWQDALPWFFELGEFRSSFPLLALDPNQEFLLVNYAHLDSTKHFLKGSLTDPSFAELVKTCYLARNVTLPAPFFCKIAPF